MHNVSERRCAPLQTLESARESNPGERPSAQPSSRRSRRWVDEDALRSKLEELAGDATDSESRAAHLVRAAEIAERRPGGDDDAVRLYVLAREAMACGATRRRTPAPPRRACRGAASTTSRRSSRRCARSTPGRESERVTASALLAGAPKDFPTLRLAERLARRARSAPQLANALRARGGGRPPGCSRSVRCRASRASWPGACPSTAISRRGIACWRSALATQWCSMTS